jgi:hypothetical protein
MAELPKDKPLVMSVFFIGKEAVKGKSKKKYIESTYGLALVKGGDVL